MWRQVKVFLICLVLSFPVLSQAEDYRPFAVLELYTSEGCSSCPPADRLLRDMVQQSRKVDARIFPLEFHVDYWDYLGWKDPFADRRYSRRQRAYAKVLKSKSVYTPQMIVNGRTGFGGYRKDKLRTSLQNALQEKAQIELNLKVLKYDAGVMDVECALSDIDRSANLNFALVERNIISQVERGENAGKTLKHDNVVRAFQVVPIDYFTHETKLSVPDSVNLAQSSVIAYVQKRDSFEIIGADQVNLEDLKNSK